MALTKTQLFLSVTTVGSILMVFTTMYLSKMEYRYTQASPLYKSRPSRLSMDRALSKAWTNLSAHPFCPNLQWKQRRMYHTYEDHIPSKVTWTSLLDMTHPNFTTFQIAGTMNRDNFSKYLVCDKLRLIIQARNGRNESKTYGGDYFRAKIYTKNSTFQASSMSDGEVIDHGNGTYSAFFTLKWAGDVGIQVTLIHPSEANYVLRRLQKEEVIRMHFKGLFYSNDPKKAEETFCNMDLNMLNVTVSKNESCNFTDASTGSLWFCVKPHRFSCSNWVMHHTVAYTAYISDISAIERLAFTWNDKRIAGTENSFVVHHMPGKESIVHSGALDQLPSCRPMVHFETPEVAGFYWGNKWNSADCKIQEFNKSQASSLLQNKIVYFFGDSTVRQLFEFYVKLFGLKTKPTPKKKDPWYVGLTSAKDNSNKINFLFQFHGLPIGKKEWAKLSIIKYIANQIDSIKGGENTVLVLTLWAHFPPFPPWYYEARVDDILESVRRLQERSPRTLVVWKSGNTREHHGLDHYLKFSDWTARDLDRRMRNKVLAYENVGFLDAWDMTNAQLEKDSVHPKGSHVENLSNKLLTYVLNHDTP